MIQFCCSKQIRSSITSGKFNNYSSTYKMNVRRARIYAEVAAASRLSLLVSTFSTSEAINALISASLPSYRFSLTCSRSLCSPLPISSLLRFIRFCDLQDELCLRVWISKCSVNKPTAQLKSLANFIQKKWCCIDVSESRYLHLMHIKAFCTHSLKVLAPLLRIQHTQRKSRKTCIVCNIRMY